MACGSLVVVSFYRICPTCKNVYNNYNCTAICLSNIWPCQLNHSIIRYEEGIQYSWCDKKYGSDNELDDNYDECFDYYA